MDRFTNKTQSVISAGGIVGRTAARDLMNSLIKALIKLGILTEALSLCVRGHKILWPRLRVPT